MRLADLRHELPDGTAAYDATIDGGYPVLYLTSTDETVCPTCANESDGMGPDPTDGVYGFIVFYEGPALACDACGTLVESFYGDPDADVMDD